jgi:hypothetical protein
MTVQAWSRSKNCINKITGEGSDKEILFSDELRLSFRE